MPLLHNSTSIVRGNHWDDNLIFPDIWHDDTIFPPLAVLSILETKTGVMPIVRAKIYLDSGEVLELKKINSVGGLSKKIEYTTGKASAGNCSISLCNNDNRYSDNYANALTYFDLTIAEASRVRYLMKKIVIEFGFDWLFKSQEEYWFPLFTGYITNKTENGDDKTVSMNLYDEYKKIFDVDLCPIIRRDEIVNYIGLVDDSAEVQTGVYFGKFGMFTLDRKEKDKHLLIPCCWNEKGTVFPNIERTAIYPNVNQSNGGAYKDYFMDSILIADNELYFWLWNDKNVADGGWQDNFEKQYGRLTSGFSVYSDRIVINYPLTFDVLSSSITLDEYFDINNYSSYPEVQEIFEPAIGLATEIESNPVVCLYEALRKIINLPFVDFNKYNDTNWLVQELDFDDANNYSWDTAKHFCDLEVVKACIRFESSSPASNLVDEINKIVLGSFFVGYGRKVGANVERRLEFVVNQPRRTSSNIKTITSERIHNPQLDRSITDVKNSIKFTNFQFNTITKRTSDIDVYSAEDSSSISAYGRKEHEVKTTATSNVFLYDSSTYALFMAQHFLMVYKEPPQFLSFKTDLIGRGWDLKNLMGIKEMESLKIDSRTNAGVFEVYSIKFGTGSFFLSFGLRWAGYLLNPDGDLAKEWAFCADAFGQNGAYCDDGDPNGIEYYCW